MKKLTCMRVAEEKAALRVLSVSSAVCLSVVVAKSLSPRQVETKREKERFYGGLVVRASVLVLSFLWFSLAISSQPRGSSDSLVDMLLTVLCNISAYIKSFCLESCTRLLALMDRLSRKAWLFSSPQHYHDLFFLLDVFNNLIQYQFEVQTAEQPNKQIFLLPLRSLGFPTRSS